MDQQRNPSEVDLGYGDGETDLGYVPSPPQELELTGTARGVHFDATASSFGDSFDSFDSSSFDHSSYDSTTSWEEGMAHRRSDAAASKKPKKRKVAARQQKRVSQARIFVLLLLAVTSVGISLLVFFVTRDKEEEDYKHHVSWNSLKNCHVGLQEVFVKFSLFLSSLV